MNKSFILMAALALACSCPMKAQQKVNIGKSDITLKSDLLTPEGLWAMGRISGYAPSPDGKQIVYQVGYYSVKENKSHHVLCIINADGTSQRQLTTSADNETDPSWLGSRIAFITGGEIWTMEADGSDRRQLSHTDGNVEGYKFSPDGNRVVYIKQLPFHEVIKENPSDLPKATGRLVTDLMWRASPIPSWPRSLPTALAPPPTSWRANPSNAPWSLLAASSKSTGAATPSR